VRKMTIALVCTGALLLAACGDDDGDDVDAADSEFCQQFRGVQEGFDEDEQDFDEAMDQLEEALNELRTLDPPSEIADEWETYLDGLEAFTEFDPTDPEAAEAAQQDLDQEELQDAMQTVDTYLRDECGIDLN
jgi:hypothetical protein